jgi:hypothetical protein
LLYGCKYGLIDTFLNLKQLQPKVYVYATRLEYGFAGYFLIKLLLIPLKLNHYNSSLYYLVATFILLTLATFVIVGLLMQKNLLNIFWYLAAYALPLAAAVDQYWACFCQIWEKVVCSYTILLNLLY